MSNKILEMYPGDSVAVALQALVPGLVVKKGLSCIERIPSGHKIAIRSINAGEPVIKYGQMIGIAASDIAAGAHVHLHNLSYTPIVSQQASMLDSKQVFNGASTPAQRGSFQGYLRSSGRVGTRNYIGVMATVNCSSTVVARIARHFQGDSRGVDGVIPITHQSGCGIAAGNGLDITVLRRVLSGYLRHPNFFGWLIVGLGCEVNQASGLLDELGDEHQDRIHAIGIQDEGGTSATINKGIAYIEDLLDRACQMKRETAPLSALRVGLQCGGSDAWSGVTANPALGAAVDRIVAHGGSAILSETPEIYGAERLLYCRVSRPEVAKDLEEKVNWWHQHLARHGQDMNNNPSPGNLAGGITTILEKSLGAVAKSGTTPLSAVLSYAQFAESAGLLFMDSPGFDPCSITGQIAAGANLICFTTGRGSTFGAPGAPTLKLASNHALYKAMSDDMDIDCGAIATGDADIDAVGEKIFQQIVTTASGATTASEKLGLGEYEFVPWSPGAVV